MKTSLTLKNFFNLNKPLQLCEEKLNGLLLRWPLLESWLGSLRNLALQGLRYGRAAFRALVSDGENLVGVFCLTLGVCSVFLHQLFDQHAIDRNWYYLNWFYFFHTLRFWLLLAFWSLALWRGHRDFISSVMAGMANIIAVLMIIHYSFVYDYESYHAWPVYHSCIASVALSFCLYYLSEYFVHAYNHWIRGNHMRFVGVGEMKDTPASVKGQITEQLAIEYRKLEKRTK